MTLQETMSRLEALGDDAVKARNIRVGASENGFGVKRGDLRTLAKQIGRDRDLALALWQTANVDAQMLAILLLTASKLSADELDEMVRSAAFDQTADWLTNYIIRKHKAREALRQRWMTDEHPIAARVGWSLTADRVAKDADGLDLVALLDRLEAEMGAADPQVQWTMNTCLAHIGIHHPDHRARVLSLGEAIGAYRDYPVSRGCTSPFAPIWVAEMVRREG